MLSYCKQCQKQFKHFPSNKAKFCTQDCYHKYYRIHPEEKDKSYLKNPQFKKIQQLNAKKQWDRLSDIGKQKAIFKLKEGNLKLRKFEWSRNYQFCVECHSNNTKHSGHGLCLRCYQSQMRDAKRKTSYFVNGNFYGTKGIIEYGDMNETLQCHLCGNYYKNLGTHIIMGHKIDTNWYKKEFELNNTFGLINNSMKIKLSNTLKRTLLKGIPSEVIYAREHIGEISNNQDRHRKKRLQSVLKIQNKAPNWMKYATEDDIKKWEKKMHKGAAKIIDSKCAKCGIDIKTRVAQRNVTYCDDCRRLSFNESHRKWNRKRKNNLTHSSKIMLH